MAIIRDVLGAGSAFSFSAELRIFGVVAGFLAVAPVRLGLEALAMTDSFRKIQCEDLSPRI